MILTDLQNAFDTVSHKVLLAKLHAIAFCEKRLAWF